jgi:oxygen-independent coproporphyrinogen-3 oxidase
MCGLELPATTLHGGLEAAYQRLAAQEAHGLVRVLEDRIVLTEAGRLELPKLCSELEHAGPASGASASSGSQAWLS